MKTYKEMNEKIAEILRISEEPVHHYAAQYIEELQKENSTLTNANDLLKKASAEGARLYAENKILTEKLKKANDILYYVEKYDENLFERAKELAEQDTNGGKP